VTTPDPAPPATDPPSPRSWGYRDETISDRDDLPKIAEKEEAPEVLDCRGQRCPLPVIALARRLPSLPVGAVLRVLADDPAAANDIPAWCRMRDHEYVGASDGPAYDVRRRH
jgi:tRNA 2-thiouridine synthesizing protein A